MALPNQQHRLHARVAPVSLCAELPWLYLTQAQRNLIDLYLQKKIWSYWIYESAWGHLNLTNPDPADKDNMMLRGWFGLNVGMYI